MKDKLTLGRMSDVSPASTDATTQGKLFKRNPILLVAVKIVDAAGDETPTDVVGELLVRTPSITKGYFGKPNLTGEAIRNGWYRTGDAGFRDSEGYLHIVDRVKDMIISGGENIYSVEVERAIEQHPSVSQVAVIGVPHERWGEMVKAIVILKESSHISETDLVTFCKARIGSYKVPKSIEFVGSFPLSPQGKILKHELRRLYGHSK